MMNCRLFSKLFFMNLLKRRQFIIDVLHPGRANVSKADLKAYVAKQFNVADPATIVSFGFRTQFGGGRSSGFCLIYENQSYLKMFEPRYRQIRAGLKQKVERSRKQMKEAKNRGKKVWGTGRRAALKKERRAAAQE